MWYKDAEQHNENGPARIYYNKNRKKESEEWYKDGQKYNKYVMLSLNVLKMKHYKNKLIIFFLKSKNKKS